MAARVQAEMRGTRAALSPWWRDDPPRTGQAPAARNAVDDLLPFIGAFSINISSGAGAGEVARGEFALPSPPVDAFNLPGPYPLAGDPPLAFAQGAYAPAIESGTAFALGLAPHPLSPGSAWLPAATAVHAPAYAPTRPRAGAPRHAGGAARRACARHRRGRRAHARSWAARGALHGLHLQINALLAERSAHALALGRWPQETASVEATPTVQGAPRAGTGVGYFHPAGRAAERLGQSSETPLSLSTRRTRRSSA